MHRRCYFSQNKGFSFRFMISLKELISFIDTPLFYKFCSIILFKFSKMRQIWIYMLQQNIYRSHERKKEIYSIALFHFRVRNHLTRSIVTRIIKLRYIFLCRTDRENVACTVKWSTFSPTPCKLKLVGNWEFIWLYRVKHSALVPLFIGNWIGVL